MKWTVGRLKELLEVRISFQLASSSPDDDVDDEDDHDEDGHDDNDDEDIWIPGIHCWHAIAILAAVCTPEQHSHHDISPKIQTVWYLDFQQIRTFNATKMSNFANTLNIYLIIIGSKFSILSAY